MRKVFKSFGGCGLGIALTVNTFIFVRVFVNVSVLC